MYADKKRHSERVSCSLAFSLQYGYQNVTVLAIETYQDNPLLNMNLYYVGKGPKKGYYFLVAKEFCCNTTVKKLILF